MAQTSETNTLIIDGRRFSYAEQGQGDPVILIHGGGPGASGLSNYSRNLEALSRSYRTLTVDLPGFGNSEAISLDRGVFTTYAEVVGRFMDQMEVPAAHFVGNSLGGAVSLKLALSQPKRVLRLVAMGTGGSSAIFSPMVTEGLKHLFGYYRGAGPSREKLRAFLDTMIWDASVLTDELIEQRFQISVRPEIMANPPFGKDAIPPIEPLWQENLTGLPHDVLLVWGRDDRTLPLECAFNLLRQLAHGELHVITQCGHWVQWEKPEIFNRIVLEFLGR